MHPSKRSERIYNFRVTHRALTKLSELVRGSDSDLYRINIFFLSLGYINNTKGARNCEKVHRIRELFPLFHLITIGPR